jgi:geranylgeranyl transferase type-2 subunit alpha
MHGHKRSDYKASQRNPNVAASLALKAEQWHALSQDLAQRRLRNDTSDITLALLEKLLLVNPDPLYLWNHRRELLVTVESNFCLETELRLTQAALANNPKAYGAWFHRKWCLVQTHHNNKLSDIKELLTSELQLTALVLQRDERNFHCWNYRTFIVSCQLALVTPQTTCPDGSWNIVQGSDDDSSEHYKHRHQHNSLIVGAQIAMRNDVASSEPEQLPLPIQASAAVAILQQEYDFSRQKIRDNFSNFSAFHYRSKLLPLLIAADERELKQIILAELELVESAVFTEPDEYVKTL